MAQTICVAIRGSSVSDGCTIPYPSSRRWIFRVLRRRNDAHFLVRDDAKILGEAMGSVLKGRTEIGIIGDGIRAHEQTVAVKVVASSVRILADMGEVGRRKIS